jgi:hypothetical protein
MTKMDLENLMKEGFSRGARVHNAAVNEACRMYVGVRKEKQPNELLFEYEGDNFYRLWILQDGEPKSTEEYSQDIAEHQKEGTSYLFDSVEQVATKNTDVIRIIRREGGWYTVHTGTKELRGQPFIAIAERTNRYNKKPMERVCDLCFYRENEGMESLVLEDGGVDCLMTSKKAHRLFGVKEDEYLPRQLDGKEVGNYCPLWLDFRAE